MLCSFERIIHDQGILLSFRILSVAKRQRWGIDQSL